MRSRPTKQDGLRTARELKEKLVQRGYPIREVFLFGSVAHDSTHRWSDIDVAILCDRFLDSKHDENVQFLLDSKEVDMRIQTICLHPEDLENRYFGLAQEVKRHGIPV